MAKQKSEIIESALEGGAIGAALGALLTGKANNTMASALVGAAIAASLKALEESKEINTPVMYEENGSIYKISPDGKKEFVKRLPKSRIKVPTTLIIE